MLILEGAYPQTSGGFYISVVKYDLMFGSETYVVTYLIFTVMMIIHNQATCQISGRIPHRLQNGGCV